MLLVGLQLCNDCVFLLQNQVSFSAVLFYEFLTILQLNFKLVDNISPFSDSLLIIPFGVVYECALRHG